MPMELQLLESLLSRMDLAEKEKQYYLNLKKGFDGEQRFDQLTDKYQSKFLILNDLLLQVNNTTFQIDSLLIADTIHIFEVKNYSGDFYYESDRIYKTPNLEIVNPLNQLSRSESLLRLLLQKLGFSFPINGSVIFINPEFMLYQAPTDKPFIFPTQINRFCKQLFSNSLKPTKKQKDLANKLSSLHITESPFSQLPTYEYQELRTGIICSKCKSFSVEALGKYCFCEICEEKELIEEAILRSVKEYKLLFPNAKITTVGIYDWCDGISSKKTISRILERNFNKVAARRWTHFE